MQVHPLESRDRITKKCYVEEMDEHEIRITLPSACLKNAVITGGQIGLNVTYSELESPFPLHSCPSQLPLFVILTGNAVSSAHKVSHHLSSARRRGEIRVGASLTSGESRRRPSAQDMTKGPSGPSLCLSVVFAQAIVRTNRTPE